MVECLNQASGNAWTAFHGDCVDVIRQLPDASIGFSVFSPPFATLFIYSDSAADMGNSADDEEFYAHYRMFCREIVRVMKPGRLVAVHCSDLPYTKFRDGYMGIKDVSGRIIREHEDAGFVLHSRITVWKCPVVEMTRTKAHGLLYKTLQSDSSRSRQGMADYLLVFRAPGENTDPVRQNPTDFPLSQWQEWASPVWSTINQTNTLNVKVAREAADERHVCPLQLDLIERAMIMWSNPGDVVLSPFMGIGSEGWVAMKLRRKFVGVELKEAYWRQACRHIAEAEATNSDLFAA